MTSRDFAFWLQGFFEIAEPDAITPYQVQLIQRHLSLVFVHEIDPSHGGPKEQEELYAVHNPPRAIQSTQIGRGRLQTCRAAL